MWSLSQGVLAESLNGSQASILYVVCVAEFPVLIQVYVCPIANMPGDDGADRGRGALLPALAAVRRCFECMGAVRSGSF